MCSLILLSPYCLGKCKCRRSCLAPFMGSSVGLATLYNSFTLQPMQRGKGLGDPPCIGTPTCRQIYDKVYQCGPRNSVPCYIVIVWHINKTIGSIARLPSSYPTKMQKTPTTFDFPSNTFGLCCYHLTLLKQLASFNQNVAANSCLLTF